MILKKDFHFISLIAVGFISLLMVGGCAITKDSIVLDYQPQTGVEKIKGAENVPVKVKVDDARNIRDKVSCKKNAYGMEMASIVSNNDVVTLVCESIKTELRNRGFNVEGSDILAEVELVKFYNDFKTGFFSGDAVAELVIAVKIKQANGNINYSKSVTGTHTETGIQLASGNNAKTALEGALRDAVARLTKDDEFIKALLKSNKPS